MFLATSTASSTNFTLVTVGWRLTDKLVTRHTVECSARLITKDTPICYERNTFNYCHVDKMQEKHTIQVYILGKYHTHKAILSKAPKRRKHKLQTVTKQTPHMKPPTHENR